MHKPPTTTSAAALDLNTLAELLDDATHYRAGEGRCEHPWRDTGSESCEDCVSDHAQADKYAEFARELRAIVEHHRSIPLTVTVGSRGEDPRRGWVVQIDTEHEPEGGADPLAIFLNATCAFDGTGERTPNAAKQWVWAVERSSDYDGPEIFAREEDAHAYIDAAGLDVSAEECLVIAPEFAAELIEREQAEATA